MKIGDRIFVRGYIDEIRKDTVIVRNDGGYFGTIPSEVTPSAQPETHEERTETHACDCISRQAAKEAVRMVVKDLPTRTEINILINDLPSAQTELENKILAIGYTGKEGHIYIGGRLFAVRELAQ